MIKFDSIESAIEDIRLGKIIIVIDDENRENEGDFIMAADRVTPEAINFMATYGRGLICTPITSQRAKELDLNLMAQSVDAVHETAFTVSVDYVDAGTGISCKDRAITINAMLDKNTDPTKLLRPGHVFPLIAKDGGVLERDGHTEAAVDLARLAGCDPSGVICEIMDTDGTMATTERLYEIAQEHGLKFITIEDLIKYRKKAKELLSPISEETAINLPNKFGDFKMHLFEDKKTGEHHTALVKGDVSNDKPVLVRVHSECLTGDVFGSKRCDCGEQLENSMRLIEAEGAGVFIYMKQEGRGIGLSAKLKSYDLQDKGLDTVEANRALGFEDDLRTYEFSAEMLKHLGVKKVNLLTNNPKKIEGLEQSDINVVNRCSIEIVPNEMNKKYLETKRDRMDHMILADKK
jgi:3,4-dihydroxy 2-butanone 4-phosphate synthase/GTP cyclohydrolase II